ncbi:hypothetical protein DY000_02025151 [Brassica cretica]|uniref:Uncharacterized protein n=1 Tax=Brassica cretica TaxID=69181 RepID=A0ABQ7E0E8_BRACR|nr:hypothetical protein DY000_02025151 [Brassica cretica]
MAWAFDRKVSVYATGLNSECVVGPTRQYFSQTLIHRIRENMFVLRFCLFGGDSDDRVSLLSRNGLRYGFYVFNPIKNVDDRASSWFMKRIASAWEGFTTTADLIAKQQIWAAVDPYTKNEFCFVLFSDSENGDFKEYKEHADNFMKITNLFQDEI